MTLKSEDQSPLSEIIGILKSAYQDGRIDYDKFLGLPTTAKKLVSSPCHMRRPFGSSVENSISIDISILSR